MLGGHVADGHDGVRSEGGGEHTVTRVREHVTHDVIHRHLKLALDIWAER